MCPDEELIDFLSEIQDCFAFKCSCLSCCVSRLKFAMEMQETLNRKVTESGLAKQQLKQNATFHKFSATFFNEMFSFHDILIFF